jgi:hypothetical protein
MKCSKVLPVLLILSLGACTSESEKGERSSNAAAPDAGDASHNAGDGASADVGVEPRCAPGFAPIGDTECQDIDECAEGQCPFNVTCENTEGRYDCPCEGDFTVGGFRTEQQIKALGGCTSVTGNVSIEGTALGDLDFLDGLRRVDGYLWIGGYESRGGFEEQNPDLENIRGLRDLTEVGGQFWINDSTALSSLDGLQSLARVGETLEIAGCTSLQTLGGLENLTEAGGVFIAENNGLTNLSGLSGLRQIDGWLQIWSNEGLPSLEGLEGLQTVSGRVRISLNYALTSVTGLEGLKSVESQLEMVGNNRLSSLAGFASLASVGGDLKIKDHPNLASCEVEGLRDRLGTGNIGGEVIIEGNTGSESCD